MDVNIANGLLGVIYLQENEDKLFEIVFKKDYFMKKLA